jgi:inorganic triphosphatase YgiF
MHGGKSTKVKAAEARGAASTETELKLVVPPVMLASVAAAPVVERHARNRGTVRLLRAVYYDTADRALWRAGFTLRVRRQGGAHMLTVKSKGPAGGDMLSRREWEAPVAGAEPDLSPLAADLPGAFHEALGEAGLEPVFATRVRRRARRLDLAGASIEMAVDEGEVVAGALRAPVSEIELELLSGRAEALYEVALGLLEAGPADISFRSKAVQGFDLAFGAVPGWTKAGRTPIEAEAPLDEAFAAMLGAALRHLIDNKAAALDGSDPEGVHQLRVALRRLRSILRIVARATGADGVAAFGDDARWLASAAGDARNWDVFLAETLPPIEAVCAGPEGFVALRRAAEERRARGYGEICAALADIRAQRFQIALALWIERRGWRIGGAAHALETLAGPASHHAAQVLHGLDRKVLKRGRRFTKMTAEERHELRLAVKKLRYATDFLMPLCASGRKMTAYAKGLSRLQDGLGRFNDMATTLSLVTELRADGGGVDIVDACGVVRGWLAHANEATEAELRDVWVAFAQLRRPWPA